MKRQLSMIFALLLVMLPMPAMMILAQEMSNKFAWTTQLFLSEQKKQQTGQQTKAGPRRTPAFPLLRETKMGKPHRLIASPDTVGGVAYISCFIHLKDEQNLNEVRSLGVEIEETFDGLGFVTARVPVNQIEPLAAIDNVTSIKVAECMHPFTDVARQSTNADDLLTLSADATANGITNKYDGTGVVLGIIDSGIDYQHIAFKDKDGKSRIKRAYVYNGTNAKEYTDGEITSTSPTTDDYSGDHGTHTASTAGGSSVIVNGTTVTVTDDHANATYGGMAPGADLYLAGIKGLPDTYIVAALKKMVSYADEQGKPLVVSNSWGKWMGPHDGTGELADVVGCYFGDDYPNHIILFSSGNNADSRSKDNEGGGIFVKKNAASSSSPLGTIIRSWYYGNTDAGYRYEDIMACAFSPRPLYCKLHVLNRATGKILKSWTVRQTTKEFSGLEEYYTGTMQIQIGTWDSKYAVLVATDTLGLETNDYDLSQVSGSYYGKSLYTLAIDVYPASGSATVYMLAGDRNYFTNHINTDGHTWTAGNYDMCVSDHATIANAISVGAYVSKNKVKNYQGTSYTYSTGTLGDIASFSSYATADQSPTGLAFPWITAPGAQIVAGVNHYHTTAVDESSYFHSNQKQRLVVNSSRNPYGVMAGTSMSTPVAAGIVALWMQAAQSVNKSLTVNEVKAIMEQTAMNDSYTTTGANASHFGKGKIDALAGIKYILDTYNSTIPVQTITLSQTSASLTAGQTLQLSAKVLPENATDNTVTWQTNNSSVATVSATGLVTAVAEGTATITCTANDGSGVKATCAVTVTKSDPKYPDIYIQSVVCTNDNPAQISKDDKVKFSATFWNNGAAGYVYTWPVLCTVTGSNNNIDEIIVDGDLSRDYFNASASKTVNYELGVDTIQPGTYYATVLYYDMAVEKWYYNGSAMAEVTVTAPGPIYPELGLSSVTCEKTALTQNDELKMTATFYNYGATGNARTVITVMAKDEDLTIVSVGDIVTNNFPASQSTTLSYSLPLADVPEGEYYASVLFYQESDDEDEAGWYYNSKCLIEIIVADDCNLKGDVNGDCIVNGTDLVALTNIILGRSATRSAADVNGDGSVNGTDYVVLANIILGRSNARGMARTTEEGDFAGTSWIEAEPYEISAGQEKEVTIDLFNPDDEITLVQFDLDLPQGLSLKVVDGDYDIDIAGRTTWKNHSLSANATDGIIRFLLASSNNKALSGTEGAIIKMTLVADESYKGEGIALKNILLVTPEEKETKPEDIVPVGIRDIAADTKQRHTSVYSVTGQRLATPQKGINILNGKKIVVK